MARDGSWQEGSELAACVDEETLKQVVREKLTELRHGDLFMEGLTEASYLTLISDDDSKNFSDFLKVVSKSIAGEDKRKRKRIAAALKNERAIIEEEVRRHQEEYNFRLSMESHQNAQPKVTEEDQPPPPPSPEPQTPAVESENSPEAQSTLADSDNNDEDAGLDGDEGSSSVSHKRLKKKSKKKKKKKKPKKDKRRSKDDPDDELRDDDETHESSSHYQSDDDEEEVSSKENRKAAHQSADYLRAKKKFEQYRDEILANVPADVKNNFREIGFTKWGKTYLPVIQLSPFDVEPGPVRDQWMSMFDGCARKKRPMTILIFWYGVTWENRSEAYSFVPSSKIHAYKEAVEKGMHVLPKKIQKKLESGKNLMAIEQQHVDGLEDLKKEMERPKEERIKWMTQFKETYEEDFVVDDISDEEIPPKKGKKRKNSTKGEISDEDGSSKKGKKRKKPAAKLEKKSKKKRKKNETKVEDDSESLDFEDDQKAAEDQDVLEDPEAKKARDDSEYKAAMEDDVVSDVDKDDDFSADGENEQDDALNADDLVDGSNKKRKKKESTDGRPSKKIKKDPAKSKKKKNSDTTEKKEKPKLKRGRGKVKKSSTKKSPHDEEQERFEECEQKLLPFMSKLEAANTSNDVDAAKENLVGLKEEIDIISPPFVRSHGIGVLIKETRSIFGEHKDIKGLCKELTKEMKRIYNEKEEFVPKDFKPKINRDSKQINKQVIQKNGEAPTVENKKRSPQEIVKKEEPEVAIKNEEKPEVLTKKEEVLQDSSAAGNNAPEMNISERKPKMEEIVPEEVAPTPKAEAAKPGRKKFSLKGMFEKPKPTPKPREKVPDQDKALGPGVKLSPRAQAPSWLTKPIPSDSLSPHQEERNFAMEYFEEAASQFPPGKVDSGTIARALELAVYEWSNTKSTDKWSSEKYWEKVHDVVAAIVGKNRTGTIVQQIVNGDFATANDVVCLSRKLLYNSFDSS